MPKSLFFFALLLLLPALALAQPLTLVHATDLHYISPELTDNGSYFLRMLAAGDGKYTQYCEPLTQAFIAEMLELRPDAVLLSGDLTFNGALESHRALEERLRVLPQSGIPVYVMPGNHDLYSANAARFEGDHFERVPSADAEAFAAIWHAYGLDQALSRDPSSLSYAVVMDDVLLLFIDVNTATAPGVLLPATLAWAREVLSMPEVQGKQVIGISHQTLMGHNSLFTDGFQMGNAKPLQSLFEEFGVLFNLSGHMHIQHTLASPFPEIVTSAMAVSPNRYGLLRLSSSELLYETVPVDVSAWARANALSDPALLEFAKRSRQYFMLTSQKGSDTLFAGREDRAELTEYLARLNTAYFAGDLTGFSSEDALYKTLISLPGFFPIYLRSMTPDLGQDYTSFTLKIGETK